MDNETDFLKPEGDQGRLRTEPPPPERLLSTPDRSLPPGVPGDNRGRRSQRNTGSSTSIRIPAADVDKSGREQQEQPASNIHCITIVGQIEGHMILPPQNKTTKYEHILPQLVAIEQSPTIEGLLIVLNTVGGDVEAGLAIAEMIESMSKPSVSLVLGGGHSIAVPIAVSCDYSFIAETATMTIHPLRLSGLVIGVPQTYEYLDKMQDRVIKYVARHSNITEERFKEMMMRTGELVRDVGTVVIGKEAVEAGLINEVGGLHCALAKLEELRRVYKESLSESLSSEEASEAGEHCPASAKRKLVIRRYWQ